MRHLNRKAHLNRSVSHRKALFSNLSSELFLRKRIITTLGKARYARRFAERMITFARKGDLSSRRHVFKYLRNKEVLKILFDDLGPHFKNRDGGYTRIIKLGPRRGDAAPLAMIELVGFDDIGAEEPKRQTKSRLRESQKKAMEDRVEEAEAKPTAPEEAVEEKLQAEETEATTAEEKGAGAETQEEQKDVKPEESSEPEAEKVEAKSETDSGKEETEAKTGEEKAESKTDIGEEKPEENAKADDKDKSDSEPEKNEEKKD